MLEGIINEETGDIQDVPLGWFNLHQKDCPEAKYLHVLCMKDEGICLAIVFAPEDGKRYCERKEQIWERKQQISDLLAYIVTLEHCYEGAE